MLSSAMQSLELREQDLTEMGSLIQSRVVLEVSSQVQTLLDSLDSATLDIAVTGESGAGKSTLVNALRGLSDSDPRAAPTGVVETTAEPTPYPHPSLPSVRLWDLPGTGTPTFRAERYLEQVGLMRFDFFLLVASERFRESHAQLAQALAAAGRPFYFIRTKVDQDLRASRRRRPGRFQEGQVLGEIRADCARQLEKGGVAAPRVFLLSAFQLHRFDFPRLQATLAEELAGHKRHALLLALPALTAEAVGRRKETLRRHIWKKALLASLVSALPGLPLQLNVPMLVETLGSYRRSFGLDEKSLGVLARAGARSPQWLWAQVRSELARELSPAAVRDVLSQAALCGQAAARLARARLPLLENLVAGGISFVAAYFLLHSALEDFARDAQRVLEAAYRMEEEGGPCDPPDPGFLYD
ncbi:interferon-inducible GTPase 5-like [Gopherus evgoodei]|uniref:Interferon-inducible GTPase 5-like n=1 Tax=Gopherus evgoodei TaxID=1825980 RepID=A0A8C4YE29_9SAUR|nr:interferon-inducible GTPase 5-like [Gopherus evgoodei]